MIQVRILIGASIQQECLRFQNMLEDIFEENWNFTAVIFLRHLQLLPSDDDFIVFQSLTLGIGWIENAKMNFEIWIFRFLLKSKTVNRRAKSDPKLDTFR